MPTTTITNLSDASDAAIRTALSNMRGAYNARNAWIDPAGNSYYSDVLGKLKTQFPGGPIDNPAITDYIASSICVHCYNGWSYLSTAVASLVEGDYGNAIHNAYYAELRAMMSFLATQGIGVFNNQHILIDPAGNAKFATPKLGTHDFAKSAFDQWLKTPGNSETLLKLLVVENYSLKDWLDSTGFPPSSQLPGKVAAGWFEDWSMDLSVIEDEQHIRNFVSYRPQCFDTSITRPSDNIDVRLKFVDDLWQLCAPNGLFDLSILRTALEVLYRDLFVMNLSDLDVDNDWKPRLADLGMNPNDLRSRNLIDFFRRQVEPVDSQVFDKARTITFAKPADENDTEPMGIISRACLLLLITSKVIDSMLRQTGTSRTDLRFWNSNIGLKTGFWEAGNEPVQFSDLWQDVEIDLDELRAWLNKPGTSRSPYTLQRDLRKKTTLIHQLNMAYLWEME